MIGKTILHYKIIEKLGEGGMGKVFLAEDTELDRKAALKFLPEHLTTDPEIKARFKREAKATAALNHPNIITIYEVGEFEGKTYIAMEYVEGESLRERLSRQKLSLDKSIEIATEVCKGLSEAHQAGIVHRDIKPDNILLDSKGRVKIADFGLAKVKGVSRLTKAESTLGTVNYMSPEQTRGEDVDHRSDIFSFGAMLYEMITGRLPFQGDYEAAVTYSILHEEPEPVERYKANLPQGLQTVIDKTLAKTPDERYQHVDEIIVDFKSLQTQHKSGKQAASSTTTKPGRRNRIYLYGGFAAFLILLSLVVGRTYFFPKQSESIDSIAVLPLQNLSGDPEQDIFTAGMHEALITELSKISALRTISRTSVMRYKETMKSIPEIAKELDVDAVVEGSALRSGNTVRITVQLIATAPERHLWAQTFDRDLVDVLVLHSEVARQIASEIQIKVTQDEESQLRSAVAVNSKAYETYLLGRHYYQRGWEWNLLKAVEYFERAVEIDSTFAPGFIPD